MVNVNAILMYALRAFVYTHFYIFLGLLVMTCGRNEEESYREIAYFDATWSMLSPA